MIEIVSSIIFSLIDSLFFFGGENSLQKYLMTYKFIDSNSAELITGGLSAALSMICFGFIKIYLNKIYKFKENPIVDAIGILLGTFIIVLIYTIVNRKIKVV